MLNFLNKFGIEIKFNTQSLNRKLNAFTLHAVARDMAKCID